MTGAMSIITETAELADFCRRAADFPYITVDTEFIREKTYWPRLCLVQVGTPDEALAIDALADGIDLSPLFGLLADESVLKVFHAARPAGVLEPFGQPVVYFPQMSNVT